MQERYLATADLGSGKIAVSVARATDSDLQVIYYKEVPSDGIRHGAVFNPSKAADALKELVQDAEQELKLKITQVVVGLPRGNVHQECNTATLERTDPDSCITRDEIRTLKSMAIESYPLTDEKTEEIYGAVAQYFSADDLLQQSEDDIVGAPGEKLDGNFKVFVGAKSASNNIDLLFNKLGLGVADKIFVPHAIAGAVLSPEERDNGVALVEMGAGVTSVSIYRDRILRFYCAIPFGGKTITNDIKNECGFKFSLAENIKLAYGACMPDKLQSMSDKILQINDNETGESENLSVKYLSEIITARTHEILETVLYLIQKSGYAERLRNGIVLTGGCAGMTNIAIMLREMSGYSVRMGFPRRGIISTEEYPEIHEVNATASVGMLIGAARNSMMNCAGDVDFVPAAPVAEEQPAPQETETPAEETAETPVTAPQEETPADPEKKKSGIGWFLTNLFGEDDNEIIKPVKQKPRRDKKEKEAKGPSGLEVKWSNITRSFEDKIGDLFEDVE